MGSLTDYAELRLLDHTFETTAYTPVATVYLALFTATPTETGELTDECSGNAYARSSISFSAAASRKIVQSGQITFPQCSGGGWGTITHWGVMDASTSGNMLAYGAFADPIVTVDGNVPFIPDTATEISANNGVISDYLAHAWLDFMFRNVAFTQPNIHVGLCSAGPGDDDDGSTITELSGGSYARVDYGSWTAAINGAIENSADINFPTPTANWATITHTVIMDSGTLGAGNLLTYGEATPNQAPQIGDPVRFVVGAIDITVD